MDMSGYFEGWYLKQQNADSVLALIPALHRKAGGQTEASLQIVYPGGMHNAPCRHFSLDRPRRAFRLDDSLFTDRGCKLRLKTDEVSLEGELSYRRMARPRYDVMGPFRFVPGMQCRHSVFSMSHLVDGEVRLNGRAYRFRDSPGYMEGDRGVSFPERYVWTQCGWGENGVMISAASVPFLGGRFTGCVALVYLDGTEYRLATYLGARVEEAGNDRVVLRQGKDVLSARLLQEGAVPLRAPDHGGMTRTIHESVDCEVAYRFLHNGTERLRIVGKQAGFEGAWNDARGMPV